MLQNYYFSKKKNIFRKISILIEKCLFFCKKHFIDYYIDVKYHKNINFEGVFTMSDEKTTKEASFAAPKITSESILISKSKHFKNLEKKYKFEESDLTLLKWYHNALIRTFRDSKKSEEKKDEIDELVEKYNMSKDEIRALNKRIEKKKVEKAEYWK